MSKLDWLTVEDIVKRRGPYLRGFLIEYTFQSDFADVFAVGKITKIWMNDDEFAILTDSSPLIRRRLDDVSLRRLKISVTEGSNNIYIVDPMVEICYTLVPRTCPPPPPKVDKKPEEEQDEDENWNQGTD